MKLIFVHAAGSWGGIWQKQLDYFNGAEAVTLPGHPEGELCKSVEEYTDWLHEYIEEKRYKDVVLAGHSLGGAIAMLYALNYPEDLRAMVIVGTGARLRVLPEVLTKLGEAVKGNVDGWVKMMKDRWARLPTEEQEAIFKKQFGMGPEIPLNDMLCCDRFDIMDRVQDIRVPTVIISGTEDVQTPVKYANYLAEKIPGAKNIIIEGGTHFVFVEEPDKFNKAFAEAIEMLGL